MPEITPDPSTSPTSKPLPPKVKVSFQGEGVVFNGNWYRISVLTCGKETFLKGADFSSRRDEITQFFQDMAESVQEQKNLSSMQSFEIKPGETPKHVVVHINDNEDGVTFSDEKNVYQRLTNIALQCLLQQKSLEADDVVEFVVRPVIHGRQPEPEDTSLSGTYVEPIEDDEEVLERRDEPPQASNADPESPEDDGRGLRMDLFS